MARESIADLRAKREKVRQNIQQLEEDFLRERANLQDKLDALDRQIDGTVNRLLQKINASADAWVNYVELTDFAEKQGYDNRTTTRAWSALISDQLAEIAKENLPGLEPVRQGDRIGYHYLCQVVPFLSTRRIANFGEKSAQLVREWMNSL